MADTVDYHLEQMLPELDDLEKRGLFTRSEIKEIVKKRRDFEYLLKRHSTLKQDYLRYVEYEEKLEALRRIRKKRLVRDLEGTGEKWKHSLCDGASCKRIMLIYKRAVTKFKGDLTLWLQYLEYCRSQATTKMQKVATKCLQLHPKVPGLWMYAAAWEFEHNLNMNAARALMQRGLRICPQAENLWIEYFRLELTYVQKLKARRLVLGLESRKALGKNSLKRKSSEDIKPSKRKKRKKRKPSRIHGSERADNEKAMEAEEGFERINNEVAMEAGEGLERINKEVLIEEGEGAERTDNELLIEAVDGTKRTYNEVEIEAGESAEKSGHKAAIEAWVGAERTDNEVPIEAGEGAERTDTDMPIEAREDAETIDIELPYETVEEISFEDEVSYSLAQTVYRNAIAAVPSNIGFRQRFLEVLDAFEFDRKSELEEQIQSSIISDFAADESSWDWLARRHVDSQKKSIEVFEHALEVHPSAQMYELYAKYLTSLLDSETGPSNSDLGLLSTEKESYGNDVAQFLLQLYERSSGCQIWSEALAKGHLDLLLRSGRVDEASNLGNEFCNKEDLKKIASLWEWRIKVGMLRRSRSADKDKESKAAVLKLFQDAMKCVPFSESRPLWQIVMEFYGGQENFFQVILDMLEQALAGDSGGHVGADIACNFVSWVLLLKGIHFARQIYNRFLVLPGPSAKFFKLCICIEAREVNIGRTESLEHLRVLFNDAVSRFGLHDTDIWIDYYREEIKAGNVFAANNVYWRAQKTLKDPTSFIERHQMLYGS